MFSDDIDFFSIMKLYLRNKNSDGTEQSIAMSISETGTVQHVFAEIPETGEYEIWVEQEQGIFSSQDYALAWWAAGVQPVALDGDYNGNNVIDAADYTVWRDAMTVSSTSLINDPTPGTVDESDFTYWRNNFGEVLGSGAGSASVVSVPEPASLCLLLIGGMIAFSGHRRLAL